VYASARWYVQEQSITPYTPLSRAYCSYAQYTILEEDNDRTFWGYIVGVDNYAEDAEGNRSEENVNGFLCAAQSRIEPGKLTVAPCFLPRIFGGPYWIVAYNEERGYSLVSGGQPRIETEFGCRTTTKTINGSGLWLLTRNATRDEDLIDEVKAIGTELGLDTSSNVLNTVVHENCSY